MKNNFLYQELFMLILSFSFWLFFPTLNAAEQPMPVFNSEQTISMDLQDASLKDVLKIFSIQAGLNFIASEAVQDRKITLYFEKVPIKEAMERLFKANNLSYDYEPVSNIFIVQSWGEPEIQTITRVYKLKHRSVSSSRLEREKNALMQTTGITGGLASTTGSATAQEETGIVKAIEQVLTNRGKIVEDSRTNSIIITDIPSRFPIIEEVIANLDVPQSQVMLEVEMLDVNKDIVDKMGFNVGSITGASSPFTLVLPGGFMHKGARFFIGDAANKGKAGAVTLGGTYAEILDFLSRQSDTRYLARPRILTLNNETAEIGVVKDEVVNVKTEVVTQPDGPSITTQTFQRATSLSLTSEGIGVFLRVTPQINMDTNEITMVINPKTSSTSQSPQVTDLALDPEVRTTKSIVRVKDGDTIILGGLMHREKNQTVTKIPILGDVPILGIFFRHKKIDKNQERELLIFITPRILRDQSNKKLPKDIKAKLPYSTPDPLFQSPHSQAIDRYLNMFERKVK